LKVWGNGWEFAYESWPQNLKDEYAYNPAKADNFLTDAGYPNGFKTNIAVDGGVDLKLLQMVSHILPEVGIDMEIRPMVANQKHESIGLFRGNTRS